MYGIHKSLQLPFPPEVIAFDFIIIVRCLQSTASSSVIYTLALKFGRFDRDMKNKFEKMSSEVDSTYHT